MDATEVLVQLSLPEMNTLRGYLEGMNQCSPDDEHFHISGQLEDGQLQQPYHELTISFLPATETQDNGS